nr:PREDICTED: alpha-ketoglutarate-dependent dioxygenase alkB homolog 4 [Bemisia tabaci]
MDRSNFCGCKGVRTCFKCEAEYGLNNACVASSDEVDNSFVYCADCDLCWQGWSPDSVLSHPNHGEKNFRIEGVYVKNNFISQAEGESLIQFLDSMPWDLSQSGRRKQNFGPKCNFKHRKMKLGNFNGFPKGTEFIQKRFKEVDIMKDYQTIEQCSLEYDPARGALIDPHIDDCWVWGERIVTVNLLSDSVLTLRKYHGDNSKYNLFYSNHEPKVETLRDSYPTVRIPMPKNSLLVLYGEARYEWEHLIFREDITSRRVCIAYREFTPAFLENGEFEMEGKSVISQAKNFFLT